MTETGKAPRRPNRAEAHRAGVERFLELYRDARLQPYAPGDSELVASLERCVGCGNCLATCPVVGALVENPYPGPRSVGTDYSRSLPAFWTAAEIVGYCTTCMACEEACPGDVPIHRAVLMMRAKNFEQRVREGEPPLTRLKQLLVDFFAENRLAQTARWGAALQGLAFKRTATGEMKARVPVPLGSLGKRVVPPLARRSLAEVFPAPVRGEVPDGPKVAVFAGCLYNHAYTDTGRSLVEVLRRHVREVVVPGEQVCCGAPVLASGDRPTTRRLALENAKVFEAAEADFVVTACASCGDILTREYPGLVRVPAAVTPPPAAAADTALVERLSAKVRDVHAFLGGELPFRPPLVPPTPSGCLVTIHDPCHLSRGQGLAGEVRELLRAVPGVTVKEMAKPRTCCGGAGSFSLDHYEIAAAIRKDKIAGIEASGAEVVVTGCPSCRLHISDGLEQTGRGRPVRHLVDLLAEAYTGGGS